MQETQVQSLGREDPLVKEMATHSSIFAWTVHGQRSLVGYSPRGRKESDTTERLTHTHEHTDRRKQRPYSFCFKTFLKLDFWAKVLLWQLVFLFIFNNLFIHFIFGSWAFLPCCFQVFSSCSERKLLFIVVHGLVIAVVSFVAGYGF